MKQRTAIFLLALLLSVSSCAQDSDVETATESSSQPDETSSSETEPVALHDNLPADLDFEGRELRILSSQSYSGYDASFHAELVYESDGDVLNDAVYERNRTVMERFGITMTETAIPYQDALSQTRANISAGDDAYDIISLVDRDALTLATEGMIYYMDELPHIDLTREYWNQTLNESMTICDRNVLAYSDMVLTAYDFTHMLAFNSELISELSLESPYELVERGEWTLDRFNEYIEAASMDLDGNTVYDENDRYGFVSLAKQIAPCFWVASDCLSIEKDSDDLPVFTMENERMLNVLQRAFDMTWNNNYWFVQPEGEYEVECEMFAAGQALFCNTNFGKLFGSIFRDSSIDYGIIPYPKYDEAQENYYSRVEGGNPYVVPVTVGDVEFAGAMLEALACESHNIVLPAYYDTALKQKYTRDETSAEILDMIMAGRVYDFGDTFFCNYVRDGFVFRSFNNGTPIAASTIASNAASVETAIANVVEAVTAAD